MPVVVVPREDSLVRGLLTGIAAFRWLAWAWLAILLVVSRDDLTARGSRPWIAVVLAGAALAVTAGATLLSRTHPERVITLPWLALELAVGFALQAGDTLAYGGEHPQSLGSVWPLAGVLAAGVAFAGRGGLVAGVIVGSGRMAGDLIEAGVRARDNFLTTVTTVSALSTVVLYALAGGVAGYAAVKLREAERQISFAQAREEVARTLHDGVLQTLAIVQRRSTDPDLVRLAHEQERELREYLFGTGVAQGGGGDLGQQLRAAAARFEDRYRASARVVLADDLPSLPDDVASALVGAVTEALANAGKHGGARSVTVYAEPDDDRVFCSVKDDGAGYDPAATNEGVGVSSSIRARIVEVGGRVELDGNPGRGAEVRLWVPT
jgi:signal transduction histidine kinase